MNKPLLKKQILKEMDALEHSAAEGFYDATCDICFRDLNDWMQFHGYNWSDVL